MPERHDPSEVRTSSPDIILAELAKTPEEMDTELIDKAVGHSCNEKDAEILLASVRLRYAKGKRKKRYHRLFRQLGVTAAVFFVLLGAMVGVARAFNWYGLLRFFTPVAGVMLWSTPDENRQEPIVPQEPAGEKDVLFDIDVIDVDLDSIHDMLEQVASEKERKGLEALSSLYPFQQGHLFQDAMGSVLTFAFLTDDSPFYVALTDVDASVKGEFITDLAVEQVADTEKITLSDDVVLVMVKNHDSLNGQWATEDSIYTVWGNMDEQAMLQIIQILREGSP